MQHQFSAIVDHGEDGYWARCPELEGCGAQGRTREEALSNLREAIALRLGGHLSYSEDIATEETIHLITSEDNAYSGSA